MTKLLVLKERLESAMMRASAEWNDAVRELFEEKYIIPLLKRLTMAAEREAELHKILETAKHELN